MHFLGATVFLSIAYGSTIQRRAINQATFNDLVRFTKFASAAYQATCPNPLNTTLVTMFENVATSTEGFITRDVANKQIIVSFRGSQQAQDAITDANIALIPLITPGITQANNNNANAHTGFLTAWNSVAAQVIATMQSEHKLNPSFRLITTGHSLGGALSSLAGLSIKASIPDADLTMFTFGQPRTGDPNYANLVDQKVGTSKIFRGVHTFDGVPTIIPQSAGYRHHSTQFWQFVEPANPTDVRQCVGQEDPTCSDSIPSTGINAAHVMYFGIPIGLNDDPAFCGL